MGAVGDDDEDGDRAAWSAAQAVRARIHACAATGDETPERGAAMRTVWRAAICAALVGCRPAMSATSGAASAAVEPAAVEPAVTDAAVRARVAAFAGGHRLTRLERREVGAYTLHVAHLEQGAVAEDELERFSDAKYVLVEHGGALAELGVLAFVDESRTHLKRGADFSLIGVRGSPLGPLLLLERSTWYRGDPERTGPSHGTATHARTNLLVCRWTDTLVCADVPTAVTEHADVAADEATGSWGVRVEYAGAGAGQFVFTAREGSTAEADAERLPRGRVGAAELFAEYPAGSVGQGL